MKNLKKVTVTEKAEKIIKEGLEILSIHSLSDKVSFKVLDKISSLGYRLELVDVEDSYSIYKAVEKEPKTVEEPKPERLVCGDCFSAVINYEDNCCDECGSKNLIVINKKDDDDDEPKKTVEVKNEEKKEETKTSKLSSIMKKAWEIWHALKQELGAIVTKASFSLCLKEAWGLV